MKIKDLIKYLSEDTEIRVWRNREIIAVLDYSNEIPNEILDEELTENSLSFHDDYLNITI